MYIVKSKAGNRYIFVWLAKEGSAHSDTIPSPFSSPFIRQTRNSKRYCKLMVRAQKYADKLNLKSAKLQATVERGC